jgi:hypothetical protein
VSVVVEPPKELRQQSLAESVGLEVGGMFEPKHAVAKLARRDDATYA